MGRHSLAKPKSTIEERVHFETKYGTVTIHQKGVAAKHFTITSKIEGDRRLYTLENVRLSMHLERFEAIEPFFEDIKCITRFPEFDHQLKHDAPCRMRVGQTHGAAAVVATISLSEFENLRDTIMEVEYIRGEESLNTLTVQIKFPEEVPAVE